MRSSMFLADVTVVDLAYITPTGNILGSSISPKFVVSGEVTDDESVVVDFSKIKKRIKQLIDDTENGYDHKLWVFDNADIKPFRTHSNGDRMLVETSNLSLELPSNAVRVLSAPCPNILDMGVLDSCVEVDMEMYLTSELKKEYPSIEVQCKLSFEGQSMSSATNGAAWFRYVHGLKNSSSFGCQNSSHGHLSYIQLLDEREDWGHVRHPVVKSMAEQCTGMVFINQENVIREDEDSIEIQYQSINRGLFRATYNKNHIRTKVLPTETTIEFLVEYLKRDWWPELKETGATHLAVSEGLTKGAMVSIL